MRKKILLINRGSKTDNYGDQAINYTLKKIFETNGCIVECENYTKFYTRRKNIIYSVVKNISEIVRVIRKQYDVVCIGGGQLILGNNSFPFSFFIWAYITSFFSRSKLVLCAVGVDGKYTKLQKWLILKALSCCAEIYVRDIVSKDNLKNIFNIKSITMPDVVCVISNFYQPKSFLKNNHNKKNILFGITTFSSVKQYKHMQLTSELAYFENQAKLLEGFLNNSEIRLIYNTKEDYECSLKFRDYLKMKYHLDVEISKYNNLFEFIDEIANSNLVISSRMHALIIAGSYNINFLPVERNLKLKAFANEYIPFNSTENYYKAIQEIITKILY